MFENYNMPYAKGHVTPRTPINKIAMILKVWFLGWRSCPASETPTQNETPRDQRTTQDFTKRLLSPLPKRLVCAHTTVCRPASIPHMEQSAESVEAVEDWSVSPSVSEYLRDASHGSYLHNQPQLGMLTICI